MVVGSHVGFGFVGQGIDLVRWDLHFFDCRCTSQQMQCKVIHMTIRMAICTLQAL
jgi:hypothetical protein